MSKDRSNRTLHEWMDAEETVLVDVREPMEHRRESIPGSETVFDASAAISLQRQVSITAGSLVIAGTLAGLHSPLVSCDSPFRGKRTDRRRFEWYPQNGDRPVLYALE